MPQSASEEIKQQWKESILEQRKSGLSIAFWCLQNNIAPHTFYYWRDKFFPKPPSVRSDFTEISDQKEENVFNEKTGITIECHGVRIHLDPKFNPSTLKECLKALKEMTC